MRLNYRFAAPIAAGLAAVLASSLAAAAERPRALFMGPAYVEPARTVDNPAPPSANGCAVEISALEDTRRDPQVLGAFGMAIKAPAEREAWLRSVVDVGLKARGFTPSFAAAGAAPAAGTVSARIRIHAIWISTLQMNKVGSVVLRATISPSGGSAAPEQVYRGDRTSLNMWGSAKEFNDLTNQVFAQALDDLATDLLPHCGSAAATKVAAS